MSEPFQYGGQAVIEGVMMRGRRSMAVGVRHPSGEIVVHSEPLNSRIYGSVWAKRPFIRGALLLWDTLGLGMRALMFSANVALQEEETVPDSRTAGTAGTTGDASDKASSGEPAPVPTASDGHAAVQAQVDTAARDAFTGGVMWGTMSLSLLFGVGVFFITPLLLARLVEPHLPGSLLTVLVEGGIRIALFFGYVWLIGRLPDVRRVYAYHGAEHKTINAYEAGEPLVPDRVARYSVAHPRCGTSFLLYVIVISILVFGLLGRPSLPVRIASRVLFIPVVASVAYECIRFSSRRTASPLVRVLMAPGMGLQKLTTREPDTSQVEVAIAALERVLERDGVTVPAVPARTVAVA